MGVVTRARKKRKLEEEQEFVDDFISGLPDGVLGDIVTLLPTRDGARTQVLSSRWRHIWRSAPLNLDLQKPLRHTPARDFSRVLSSHPGPGRRFTIDMRYVLSRDSAPLELEAWLRCPAMDSLQELEFHLGRPFEFPPLLPASLRRFSCTLRVASFGACSFPDGNANALHLPLLNQLSLVSVRISETSLHALLAGCSVLESLLLEDTNGFPRVQIMSTSLRSIGVCSPWGDDRLTQLIIEDAPSLERLLIFGGREMDISVISAPRLHILGELQGRGQMLRFGATALQGSTVASLTTVVPSVRALALSHMTPCLDVAINLIKCFPLLEKLHVEITHDREENTSSDKYQEPIGTLDIRLRKIVLAYLNDREPDIEFAKFFVMNASMLESMTLEFIGSDAWIRRQRRLLQVEKRASKGARFDFVSRNRSFSLPRAKQVHEMLILDPFQRVRR
uniref:F-box/LRR-repeat protein 15/At3g58940/PEG3-like LRR domain-containing protein n=1 Tax=Setaria viridis TaxID=4556 RepID=A0A4V6DAL3_SETVI|nr:hypothetical protein SEVIR_2G016500v2 [Setaria viridis]